MEWRTARHKNVCPGGRLLLLACIRQKMAPKMMALLRLLIRRAMEAALSREIWRQLRCNSSLNCLQQGTQHRSRKTPHAHIVEK
jgi:hypothetical protein